MNEIRGFFQRVKDACVRLLPTGHGNHFVDTAFPHMQQRHVAQGGGGGYNSYAGGGAGRQEPTPMQLYGAVSTLRRAGIVDQQAAFDYTEAIGEMF